MSPTMTPEEILLADALATEAERATVSPDALARIERRIAAGGDELAARREFRRRTRTTAIAALVAAALLAVATVGAIAYGAGARTTPDPVDRPTPTATTPPTGGDLVVSPAPTTMTVYRYRPGTDGGQGQLSLEYIRNVRPYDPKHALDALFGTAPVFPADRSVLDNGRNRVASTTETATQIVVDMTAVDDQPPPGNAPVEDYLAAWRKTIQEAYRSDKPVVVRLNGAPTVLYGSFDTAKALPSTEPRVVEPKGIFLPRAGEAVRSPLFAMATIGRGEHAWTLTDLATGKVAQTDSTDGSAGLTGLGFDVPDGRYRLTVRTAPDSIWEKAAYQVDFEVSSEAAVAPPPRPAVEPATTPVDTVAVYFPSEDRTHLVREWRVRGAARQMLADYLTLGSGLETSETSLLGGTGGVRSVSTAGSGPIRVDLVGTPFGTGSGAERKLVDLQDQAFARTVGSVVGGEGRPVQLSVDGQPVRAAGRSWSDGPVTPRKLRVVQEDGPTPQPRQSGEEWTPLVGSVPVVRGAVTYEVFDAVSQESVAIGHVPAVDPATRRYAFGLRLPAGRYYAIVTSAWQGSDRMGIAGDLTIEP